MGRLGLARRDGRGAGQPDGSEGTAGLGAAVTRNANWYTRLAGPGQSRYGLKNRYKAFLIRGMVAAA